MVTFQDADTYATLFGIWLHKVLEENMKLTGT